MDIPNEVRNAAVVQIDAYEYIAEWARKQTLEEAVDAIKSVTPMQYAGVPVTTTDNIIAAVVRALGESR